MLRKLVRPIGAPLRFALGREDGLSLIDLLVGLILSTAVLGLTTGALHVAAQTDATVGLHSEAMAQVRTTVQRLTKELREARRLYSDSDERRLHFWVDKDQNGLVGTGERVVWTVEENGPKATLLRSLDDAPTGAPEALDLLYANSRFGYAKESGGTFQDVAAEDATVVKIDFAAHVDLDRQGGPRWVRTEVRLRNVLA